MLTLGGQVLSTVTGQEKRPFCHKRSQPKGTNAKFDINTALDSAAHTLALPKQTYTELRFAPTISWLIDSNTQALFNMTPALSCTSWKENITDFSCRSTLSLGMKTHLSQNLMLTVDGYIPDLRHNDRYELSVSLGASF